jgi:hypothetical protein
VQHIYVTQPLGTPDAIARAVADAQIGMMKGPGRAVALRRMILTYAVSGLARSGATRSGYPVLKGVKVPLYALSNVGRSVPRDPTMSAVGRLSTSAGSTTGGAASAPVSASWPSPSTCPTR